MKICLCGSTRFRDEYLAANAMFTLMGHIVYSVAVMEKSDGPITADEKRRLDLVHLKKILESDCVVVVGVNEEPNKDGDATPYIGASTRREIEWALLMNKGVLYTLGDPESLKRFLGSPWELAPNPGEE